MRPAETANTVEQRPQFYESPNSSIEHVAPWVWPFFVIEDRVFCSLVNQSIAKESKNYDNRLQGREETGK